MGNTLWRTRKIWIWRIHSSKALPFNHYALILAPFLAENSIFQPSLARSLTTQSISSQFKVQLNLIIIVATIAFNNIWQQVHNSNPNEIKIYVLRKNLMYLVFIMYVYMIFMRRNICIGNAPMSSYWMGRCCWSSEEGAVLVR